MKINQVSTLNSTTEHNLLNEQTPLVSDQIVHQIIFKEKFLF